MFYTVFLNDLPAERQWQLALLQMSWKKCGQEGALVCLDPPGESPPQSHLDCTYRFTLGTQDTDAVSRKSLPAALLEWSFAAQPEGTVLVVTPDHVFRRPILKRVAPGFPAAQSWKLSGVRAASEEYPFGLPPGFSFLSAHCARPGLQTTPARLPIVIHTDDLRRIGARWSEISTLVVRQCRNAEGQPIPDAVSYAYMVAAAEFDLRHESIDLEVSTGWHAADVPTAPLIRYSDPLISREGDSLFSPQSYGWGNPLPEDILPEVPCGRELIEIVNATIDEDRRRSGRISFDQRPRWRQGIKEGRVLDEVLLEYPPENSSLWLNVSGREIWQLCDGRLTLKDIQAEIGRRYGDRDGTIAGQVVALIDSIASHWMLEVA